MSNISRKSKKKTILVFGVLFFAISVPLAIEQLRETSPFFNFLFTPFDWNEPLLSTEIDIRTKDKTYNLTFETKYPGLHWIEMKVSKQVLLTDDYDGDFKLKLDILDHDKNIVSKLINVESKVFSGKWKYTDIYWFRSPNDLPLRRELKVLITIVKPDESYPANFESPTLLVRKLSDK